MKLSALFTLTVREWLFGLLSAVVGAILTVVYATIQTGSIDFNWSEILKVALIAGIGYLARNFLTPAPKTIEVDKSVTKVIDVTPSK
jgi:uncharacterized membrane protein